MRKISLFAGVVAISLGMGAVSATSAFAADVCLNPAAGTVDLTHNAMVPNAGWEYDKTGTDAELAKGNVCAVTQQSVQSDQVADYNPLTLHRERANTGVEK